jgi:hypothetical protein
VCVAPGICRCCQICGDYAQYFVYGGHALRYFQCAACAHTAHTGPCRGLLERGQLLIEFAFVRIVHVVRADNFDYDRPVNERVVAHVHGCHVTGTDFCQDFVLPERGFFKFVWRV